MAVSIVDYLKKQGKDSSYAARKQLAAPERDPGLPQDGCAEYEPVIHAAEGEYSACGRKQHRRSIRQCDCGDRSGEQPIPIGREGIHNRKTDAHRELGGRLPEVAEHTGLL